MADEKVALAKMLLAQFTLDNPFMKLKHLHHLAAAQVVIAVIGWLIIHERQLEGDQTRKIKLVRAVESVANAIVQSTNAMIQASNAMTEKITNILEECVANRDPLKDYDVWGMLMDMGITPPLLYKAYMLLIKEPKMLEGVIGCPDEHRKSLLLQLMGCDHESHN